VVAVSPASRVWWCFRCAARGKRCGRRRAPRKRAARGAAVVAPGSSSVRAVESTRTSASEAVEVCDALADSRAAVGDGAVGWWWWCEGVQSRRRGGFICSKATKDGRRPWQPPPTASPNAAQRAASLTSPAGTRDVRCRILYSACETCPTPLRVWTAAACATMLPAEPSSNHHESVAR
jgi:hypothetical protein